MMRKRVSFIVCTALLVPVAPALAAGPLPALEGNCPVCLVKMKTLVKGTAEFSSTYDGRTYLFPSAQRKKTFDADPAAFIPALGGNCVVCKVDEKRNVPGKAAFHVVHDGRLYLFRSAKEQEMFKTDTEKYAEADLALGGNCPVSLHKKYTDTVGKPEFISIYDGRRYHFASDTLKGVFDANPAMFAPALGGDCTICKVELKKEVPGAPEYHSSYKQRLYLFASAEHQKMFESDPGKYADTDIALAGNCPVCKVDMGEDVPGKAGFATDWLGHRYFFRSRKEREMFRANPDRYAVKE